MIESILFKFTSVFIVDVFLEMVNTVEYFADLVIEQEKKHYPFYPTEGNRQKG